MKKQYVTTLCAIGFGLILNTANAGNNESVQNVFDSVLKIMR